MDWFFHDPGQGRVGPLSADALRTRYRERRIQLDTLVWREGLREWQPLDRMADELDLLSVKPDTRLPPPLPPVAATPAVFHAAMAMPMGAGTATGRPAARQRMSGCLVAAFACAAVGVLVLAILALLAVPAYRDYVARAKVAARIQARSAEIETRVAGTLAEAGRCPVSSQEAGLGQLPGVDFGNVDGRCAFRITLDGIHPDVDGKTVEFVAPDNAGDPWDCAGGDLPAQYRPPHCRPAGASAP